ncbi:MAG: polymorphic toxin type 23 domain-containing protein [Cyclobacteriaceae bacterium]
MGQQSNSFDEPSKLEIRFEKRFFVRELVLTIALLFIGASAFAQEATNNSDINLGIKGEIRITIGFRGNHSLSGNVGLGIYQGFDHFQWGFNGAINIYYGGLGSMLSTSRNASASNQLNADLILTGTATLGDDSHETLPLITFNHNNPAMIFNDYKRSLTHAQNVIINFRGRNQRVGTLAFKFGNVYFQTYNDVKYLLGDSDDRFWSGGGSISIYLDDGYYVTIGTEVFTGSRLQSNPPTNPTTYQTIPQPLPQRGCPYLDYTQSSFQQQLNIGKLFFQLNNYNDNFNFEVSRTGWKLMASQNFIHAIIEAPYFDSRARNQWNIGLSYQYIER